MDYRSDDREVSTTVDGEVRLPVRREYTAYVPPVLSNSPIPLTPSEREKRIRHEDLYRILENRKYTFQSPSYVPDWFGI